MTKSILRSFFKIIDLGMVRFTIIDLLRGTSILRQLSLLHCQQNLSNDELAAISESKKNDMWNYAKENIPYYNQFNGKDSFPVLTKDILRQYKTDFLVPDYNKKIFKKSTGGSTGVPLSYYTTQQAQSFMWAGIVHSWKVVGYKLGDRVAFVTGTALAKNGWKYNLFYGLMNVHVYSAYHLDDNSIETYLNQIIRSKTKVIYGYPTAINVMALFILKHKVYNFPYLKGIVVTSEILEHNHRKNIELAFRVPVKNQYGCNEAGISAFECEYGNMHLINTGTAINIDHEGQLYATNLVNDAFYFINYNTGDKIKMSQKHDCSCKRGFPIIDEITGRSVDMIIDKTGKKIHSAFFSILFRNNTAIEQFQIQFDQKVLNVFIKVDTNVFASSLINEYLELIKSEMSFDAYDIYLNHPLLTTANGKHKYVIDLRYKSDSHENLV